MLGQTLIAWGIVSLVATLSLCAAENGSQPNRSATTAADPVVSLLDAGPQADADSRKLLARYLKERRTIAAFLAGRKIVAEDQAD